MKLTFYGGAQAVTGSNYLLESKSGQKILVDCGLHQGSNFCERHNWDDFAYDPKEISAVFITHAHIDHVGLLPKLMRLGFRGKVYSTFPTKDFAKELLLDSEHILLQEAERFKQPSLYGVRDVEELAAKWEGVEYRQSFRVGPFTATFYNAGHILGSSFITIEADGKKVIFSGDLGNSPAPIIGRLEEFSDPVDYCLIESVYGDRVHENVDIRKEIVEDLIEDVVKAGGTLMIPAFAMERTQELLFELNELVENGRIPRVPIFVDSPLAIKLTEVYKKHERYFDEETKAMIMRGDAIFSFPGLKMTLTVDESKSINDVSPPKVIIAGSGMSHAGRIIHHERRYLSDSHSVLLIVGYQAQGSMGRLILDGAQSVKILGEEIPVRCRIVNISGYSAHADQPQLLNWIRPMRLTLKKVFVVQGEENSSTILAQKIRDELAVDSQVPLTREMVDLV